MSASDDHRDGGDSAEELAEFERLGRRAGAELRRPPPAGGADSVVGTTSRRRIAAVTTVVACAVITAGVVLVSRQRDVAPSPTIPVAASSTTTTTEAATSSTTTTVNAKPQHIELRGHTGLVTAMDASSSASVVATGGEDGTVRAWNPDTGEQLQSVTVTGKFIVDVEVSSDGSKFAAHQADGTSSYWNIADGGTIDAFPTRWDKTGGAPPTGSFPSPDGSTRVVTGTFSGASLVDASTGNEITAFPGSGRSYAAAWASDGSLVAVRFDGNVKVWRMDTFDELQIIKTPAYQTTSEHLQFLPGNDRIAVSVEQIVIIEAVTPTAPNQATENS